MYKRPLSDPRRQSPIPESPVLAGPLRSILLALSLLWLFAGCAQVSVHKSNDYKTLYQRSVLFLEPTYLPPLDEAVHGVFARRLEQALSDSAHLGRLVNREAFEKLAIDQSQRQYYAILADTVSVVGLNELELSSRVVAGLDVDLLASAQLVYIPCAHCEDGSKMAVVTQLYDARDASLLLRAQIRIGVGDNGENQEEEAGSLVDSLLVLLDDILRPKWHRLRFDSLRPGERG